MELKLTILINYEYFIISATTVFKTLLLFQHNLTPLRLR